MYTDFWWENQKDRYRLGDLGEDGCLQTRMEEYGLVFAGRW